jgi:hypothetical protein
MRMEAGKHNTLGKWFAADQKGQLWPHYVGLSLQLRPAKIPRRGAFSAILGVFAGFAGLSTP